MNDLDIKINILDELGNFLSQFSKVNVNYNTLNKLIDSNIENNSWFSKESIIYSLKSWSKVLKKDIIKNWINEYDISSFNKKKTVALILPGNIPLVGFHDILCVWLLGYKGLVKLSSKDNILTPYLIKYLEKKSKVKTFNIKKSIIKNFDAVIATGSNNTSLYFDYYFSKYPNIIRNNKNSIAVLDGNESVKDLKNLGMDILLYYGFGCRNVSKIFVPKKYDLNKIFKGLKSFSNSIKNSKYANNYHYNKAIYLINKDKFLDNGFFILKENSKISAPISCAYFEYYNNKNDLDYKITTIKKEIQCIVSQSQIVKGIPFGQTQQPSLNDYADNIDTMKFLMKI